MTPQIQNGFNGGMWQYLENRIRNTFFPSNGTSISDTLYIATGPVYKTVGGNEKITYIVNTRDNKTLPVANYYYKVILRVRWSGKTVVAASAIGFWFEHKDYGTASNFSDYAKSVDFIEGKTGFDFFANLPDDVEATAEANASWSTFTAYNP